MGYYFIRRIIILVLIFVARNKCEDLRLDLVQVLFRHGDRTPELSETPVEDPHSSTFEKLGYGRLTKVGMQREYQLGKMLRDRYKHFIGPDEIDEVYPYSTPMQRTKTSLLLTLAGLFPITNGTSWSDEINWLPIPINYDPADSNFLWSTYGGKCSKKFSKLLDKIEDSPEMKRRIGDNLAFVDSLREKNGHMSVKAMFNYLRAIRSMGLEAPEWGSEQNYRRLENVTAIYDEAYTFTLWMTRMTGGMFMERFLQNIHNNGNGARKMYLYSANDLQIAAISRMLEFVNIPKIPDYGSAFIIEKYTKQDAKILRMFIWTGESRQMIPVKLKECEHECPVELFEWKVKFYFPKEDDKKC